MFAVLIYPWLHSRKLLISLSKNMAHRDFLNGLLNFSTRTRGMVHKNGAPSLSRRNYSNFLFPTSAFRDFIGITVSTEKAYDAYNPRNASNVFWVYSTEIHFHFHLLSISVLFGVVSEVSNQRPRLRDLSKNRSMSRTIIHVHFWLSIQRSHFQKHQTNSINSTTVVDLKHKNKATQHEVLQCTKCSGVWHHCGVRRLELERQDGLER